jgi:hypothetical protein
MGPFDKIGAALSGKKPAPAPSTKTGNADFRDLARVRDQIMAGKAPRSGSVDDGNTTSGLDRAMQDHANKVHPMRIRRDLGEIQG